MLTINNTLTINVSDREKPTKAICSECKKEISFTLHHNGLEAHCCNKSYFIQMNLGIWNCCSFPDNPLPKTIEEIQQGKFDPYKTFKNK